MILDSPFPPDARVENEGYSLIETGHEVFLFSLDPRPKSSSESINGVQVLRYKSNNLIYKLSALAYTFPFYHNLLLSRINHFIKETKPEALHIHDMVVAEAVFKVNERYGLPVVLDLHENRPEIMKHYKHVTSTLGKVLINLDTWKRWQNILMKKATKVILVTEEAKKLAIEDTKLPSENFHVVPNTITPSIFYAYNIENEVIDQFKTSFNILYVGDTGLRRGTDTAIEAIAKLKGRIPDIKLILVGSSSADDILRNTAQELEVMDNVAFMGWRDLTLFPSFIAASDICISPLKRNIHHDTTFANKIFQYMAMGKPLVVSDCPSQANLVRKENCGTVHKAGDAVDLAKQIYDLYLNRKLSNEMGERGKQAILTKYSWEIACAPELKKIYDEI